MIKEKISFSVPVYIEQDNGEYHAFCPILKGLHTRGETEEDVMKNAENAVIAYIQSLIKHGDPIPLCIIEEEKLKRPLHIIKENLIEVAV